MYKIAEREANLKLKKEIEFEIELIKLEKLILMMCFEATNFSRMMIYDNNIKNSLPEILSLMKNFKISDCNILNQSSLNFEVLIDLIKLTSDSLLGKDKIGEFLSQLLKKESDALEESQRKADMTFVSIFHAKETIVKHINFLK